MPPKYQQYCVEFGAYCWKLGVSVFGITQRRQKIGECVQSTGRRDTGKGGGGKKPSPSEENASQRQFVHHTSPHGPVWAGKWATATRGQRLTAVRQDGETDRSLKRNSTNDNSNSILMDFAALIVGLYVLNFQNLLVT
jgi:hypothetical protein